MQPRWIALVLLVLVFPIFASAQIRLLPAEVERIDVIGIERDGRDLFAFDALTGGRSTIRLELGEEVRFDQSRGRIGLVLTDRRALAVASGFNWQVQRYRLKERPPEQTLVEDRIAIVLTGQRALGFVSRGAWVEERLSPQESTQALRVSEGAGIVVTNRRALGLGPDLGRFVEVDLQVNEVLESATAQGTLATLRTNRRILVFSAPRGTWSEQKRQIKR